MLNTSTIPARNLQKAYKSIIEDVKVKKNAVVLTTNNQPQAAIVSLEDLERLKQVKSIEANLELLKLAIESREQLKDVPANLREQADKILYTKNG